MALGTNNNCGTDQPCGEIKCGCPDEPPNYLIWDSQLAHTVEQIGAWAGNVKNRNGFTDDVRVVAADDAEPAFDPGYANTYDLLEGYAKAVGGSSPAMVDYGSADAHYWTEAQLLQVAYGFRPDVPMPEIYNATAAGEWAALLSYAKSQRREVVDIFGVLAGGPGTNDPQAAYADMLGALANVTGQRSIDWLSTMTRLGIQGAVTPATG